MRLGRMVGGCVLLAFPAVAQPRPMDAAESNAWAEVQAQQGGGLFAVQPWAQMMGGGRLGVGWVTSRPADGVVEWTQDEAGDARSQWRRAWYAEDGLKQANGTTQRAVIEEYDPAKPIRFRAVSRPIELFKPYQVVFGAAETSAVRRLPAQTHPDGAVSFVVFNDVHNRVQNYPLLLSKAGAGLDFAVFNGDVLQDPQSEQEAAERLLAPMAWFCARAMPCFFLRGNHETRGAFARSLKGCLCLPEGRYYAALTLGAARVVFLDCGEDKPDGNKEYSGLVDFDPYMEAELAWLKSEVGSDAFSAAAWRLVVVHIPPDWRTEEGRLWHGERRMRERFAPLFDAGRVTAVLAGHNHKAELVEPCPDAARGFRWPVFIGGAPALAEATAIRVDATPQTLKVSCVKSDGSVFAEKRWSR